jgi:hypothetical protein
MPDRTNCPTRSRRPRRDDLGMTTAEYAIGTVAACGFAGLLLKILTSTEVGDLLRNLVQKAFEVAF